MGLLSDLRHWLRRKKLSRKTPDQIFDRYYRSNKWGDDESRSGKGSNLAATADLRALLPGLVQDLGVESFLDLPCGDFYWMSKVDLGLRQYTGGDIVPAMIAANRAAHGRDGVTFQVIDLITGPIPRHDLVFTRDCLVHLSTSHVFRAIANLRASGSTWLLTTTYPATPENAEIATGEWRSLDLTKPPFSLPPPVRLIAEGREQERGQGPGKMLGLWRIADLPAHGMDRG
jgi:hypothetical protein